MAAVQWLWEADDGKSYNKFSAAYSRMVENEYVTDVTATDCRMDMRGFSYSFDFVKMVQCNTATGSRRRVKRTGGADVAAAAAPAAAAAAAGGAAEDGAVWEWQDDGSVWRGFSDKDSAALEGQRAAGAASWTTKLRGWDYTFDLKGMTQTNAGTGKSRRIRRLPPGHPAAGGGGAAAAAPPPAAGAKKKRPSAAAAAAGGAADPPPAKKAKKSGGADDAEAAAAAAKSGGKSVAGKVVKKGRGVVDKYSGLADKGHVLETGKDVWMATLNQTNLVENNNKFYVIQAIEADAGGKWWTWNRWGRVGAVGQSKLQEFPNAAAAQADFCKKFKDKTRNDWAARAAFVKHAGKYQLMDIDYGADEGGGGAAAAAADPEAKVPDCTLPPRVRQVMEHIADKQGMLDTMKELDIDVKKMPLGKISKKQVKDAFGELKKIETELKSGKASHAKLVAASSQFFTFIPHDVGYAKLPTITTMAELEKKMEMLDTLADLEIAARVLSQASGMKEHPHDAAYASMKTKLAPVARDSEAFERVAEMVKGTHGKTHNAYTLEVTDVLSVEREGEAARYAPFARDAGRTMLWHGSRATNWAGILAQGLRIAPPEAPMTGYMFGKGVYFADCSSKSANYCHCSKGGKDVGFLMLSEVALSKSAERRAADYMEKAPAGCGSTKGLGQNAPSNVVKVDGVSWPLGPMADAKIGATSLLYNEFIVYDVSRVRTRYLVMLKFHYK